MTPEELIAKWTAEADVLRRRQAMVNGAGLCAEMLADFENVMDARENERLNLQEAAQASGYSAEHLGRLIRAGEIPNAGRPNAPRIQRKDLPRKATALRPTGLPFSVVGATPGQIARAVVSSDEGEAR